MNKGYWKDINNIKYESIKYIDEFGLENFTYKGLRANKRNDLICAIRRAGYTVQDICSDIGVEYKSNSKNYLKDPEFIKSEILKLVDEYGCIPDIKTLTSIGKGTILWGIQKWHGGIRKALKQFDIKIDVKESKLERSAKVILNKLLKYNFVDNQRKDLLKYNVNMKNPNSNQWLEIDRFYPDLRLAIEIQGQQHYKSSSYKSYFDDRVVKIIELDRIKASLLKQQGVKLLVIPYTKCSEEYIKKELIRLDVLKSGELLETPEEDNQQPSAENDIEVSAKVQRLEGEESTNKLSTSARQLKTGINMCTSTIGLDKPYILPL